MPDRLFLLLGTKKGAFILEADAARRHFALSGPWCAAWPIQHAIADQKTGTIYAAGGNAWFGPAVWKSEDLGASWSHSSHGLAYPEGEEPVKAVWSLALGPDGTLYAGVEPAGLFASRDQGASFEHVAALRAHPSRPHWNPGAGGLILHAIVPHPADPEHLHVAISAAGVFATTDGGQSFEARNRGTRADFLPEGSRYPEYGQCVHSLVMAAGRPERLYQQNHCGMYRSDDAGRTWRSIEAGLPSSFGFPVAAHPRDPDTLWLIPLNGALEGRYVPEGRAAVWRSRDGGENWQGLRQGLPQENAFFGVLRQAMATDSFSPSGVYFGTGSGELYASRDEGESWVLAAQHLPPIHSVETVTLAG